MTYGITPYGIAVNGRTINEAIRLIITPLVERTDLFISPVHATTVLFPAGLL